MHKISLILTTLLSLAMIVVVAPNIFAANKGKVLRTVAIWLAIFAGLGLIYQNFGPQSPHPLFGLPEAMSSHNLVPMRSSPLPPPAPSTPDEDSKPGDNTDGTQGFTPPKE